MRIDFLNKTKYEINESIIEKAINAVINNLSEKKTWEISVAIVSPDEIQSLNNQYRGKNAVTDVLSFPMDDEKILGDIVICYERCITQAEEIGNTAEKELFFLTIHSMLHLFGYDHMDKQSEEEMKSKQKEIMNAQSF